MEEGESWINMGGFVKVNDIRINCICHLRKLYTCSPGPFCYRIGKNHSKVLTHNQHKFKRRERERERERKKERWGVIVIAFVFLLNAYKTPCFSVPQLKW